MRPFSSDCCPDLGMLPLNFESVASSVSIGGSLVVTYLPDSFAYSLRFKKNSDCALLGVTDLLIVVLKALTILVSNCIIRFLCSQKNRY